MEPDYDPARKAPAKEDSRPTHTNDRIAGPWPATHTNDRITGPWPATHTNDRITGPWPATHTNDRTTGPWPAAHAKQQAQQARGLQNVIPMGRTHIGTYRPTIVNIAGPVWLNTHI
jgi:hypothetical protein